MAVAAKGHEPFESVGLKQISFDRVYFSGCAHRQLGNLTYLELRNKTGIDSLIKEESNTEARKYFNWKTMKMQQSTFSPTEVGENSAECNGSEYRC